MIAKFDWQKIASVTRPGRSFYRLLTSKGSITVAQSFLTGMWNVTDDKGLCLGEHSTSQQARKCVEQSLS